MGKILVSEIEPNQEVTSSFVVTEKQLRVARNGTPFLTLKLADKTGEIVGRIWDRADELSNLIPSKGVVLLRGRSEKFRDELQLQIQEISLLPPDQIDASDFLPICPEDPEFLFEKFRKLIATIKRRSLVLLMKQFLADHDLMQRFKTAPAAKSMHHAYLGGLLEHTVSVTELVSRISEHYPDLDRDLLTVGAVLHDVGKVYEFSYDLHIEYSNAGRLLGHMILGLEILEPKIRAVKSFPLEEALLLKHLVLSHHGEAEFGAVKLPMTREAMVLHFADDLDAKVNSVTRILSESGGSGDIWTSYQPLFERFFFRGFPPGPEESKSLETAFEEPHGVQLNIWSADKIKKAGA